MKKALKLLVILSLVFVLSGCTPKDVEPESIAIKTTTTVASIGIGDTLNLTYAVTPADAKIDGVIWSVNDATVATISEDGVLNGISKGVVKVTVTVEGYDAVTISKYFSVTTDGGGDQYPDLGGYTIKIANASQALGEYDVFINQEEEAEKGYYGGADRNQKRRAWSEIEDLYNCNIEIVAYPANAPWGPDRWAYIVSQFQQNDVQYD
ncbi:MAG: Ig-like domain-containing protein, partial [Bacilli bacterium]